MQTRASLPEDRPAEPIPIRKPWTRKLRDEIRSRPFGYSVLAVAFVTGPVLISMIFPGVSTTQAIVGGIAFGVWAAVCAVPQKFM